MLFSGRLHETHFPVTLGTVVVPYYPSVNDMVFVKGHDEETWRARVRSFSIRRHVVTGRFFKKRHDELWEPEGTRNQDISFRNILGVVKGTWVNQFSIWHDA